MPKVKPLGLSLGEKQLNALIIETRKAMAELGIRHDNETADLIGITRQAFYNRMKSGAWTLSQLGELFKALHFTDAQILRVMRGAEK